MARPPKKADDAPPLMMRYEKGKLVPLAAYDAERLETFSGRPVIYVTITAPQSPLRIKWHAILNEVIKNCRTPWTNVEAARDALKVSFGVVESRKVNGELRANEPASFHTLDEDEFKAFFEGSMALLYSMTGVDPETLWRKSPDVYEPLSEEPPPSSDDAARGAPPQLPASGHQSADDGGSAADDPTGLDQSSAAAQIDEAAAADPETVGAEVQDEPAAAPAVVAGDWARMVECLGKFLYLSTDVSLPDAKARQDMLPTYRDLWRGVVPDVFLKACVDRSNDVIRGKISKMEASRYLEAMLP